MSLQMRFRAERRREAQRRLSQVLSGSNLLIVHYSCESFYDCRQTPRITAISVRDYRSGQTKFFSIHTEAERKGYSIDVIEKYYDELEKSMLNGFYRLANKKKNYYWIHWNMRDIHYGFEALEHRHRVLGGKPANIADELKLDLARLMVDLYGENYIGHPRLENLIKKNGITALNFLSGEDEAEAFKNNEFVKLQLSSLRKVEAIHSVLEKTVEGTLKTQANLIAMYGLTPQGLFEASKDNWLWALLFFIFGGIITRMLF